MLDGRLSTWLLGRDSGARDRAMRGLLSALWSFLQHPAGAFEDHLTALEERLRALETRLVGDVKTAVDTGVIAIEETVTGAEHRLEEDFERAIHGRVVGIRARLETVKTHVVEVLKRELRQVALLVALMMAGGVLALVARIFGLMAAWTDLKGIVGAAGASLVLAVVFLLASLVVIGLLRSVLHRYRHAPSARNTAT
jgi:hypothetical protein